MCILTKYREQYIALTLTMVLLICPVQSMDWLPSIGSGPTTHRVLSRLTPRVKLGMQIALGLGATYVGCRLFNAYFLSYHRSPTSTTSKIAPEATSTNISVAGFNGTLAPNLPAPSSFLQSPWSCNVFASQRPLAELVEASIPWQADNAVRWKELEKLLDQEQKLIASNRGGISGPDRSFIQKMANILAPCLEPYRLKTHEGYPVESLLEAHREHGYYYTDPIANVSHGAQVNCRVQSMLTASGGVYSTIQSEGYYTPLSHWYEARMKYNSLLSQKGIRLEGINYKIHLLGRYCYMQAILHNQLETREVSIDKPIMYMFIYSLLHKMAHITRAHSVFSLKEISLHGPLSKWEKEYECDCIGLLAFGNEDLMRAAIKTWLFSAIEKESSAALARETGSTPDEADDLDSHPPARERLKRVLYVWIELKKQREEIDRNRAIAQVKKEYLKMLRECQIGDKGNIIHYGTMEDYLKTVVEGEEFSEL